MNASHIAQGCFVTGTDTGVGKTCVSAALLRLLGDCGGRTAGFKPVAAGMSWMDGEWVPDADGSRGGGIDSAVIFKTHAHGARRQQNITIHHPRAQSISRLNEAGSSNIQSSCVTSDGLLSRAS